MALNLSRGPAAKYYSSDRISQLMGNGLLTFIDNKMSNIVKLSQNKMNEGMEFKDIFEVIKQDFGEFINISKIENFRHAHVG